MPLTPRRCTGCSRKRSCPRYYERDASGVPHRWMAVVKQAIRTVAPRFSARRMVKEYVERMYAPAIERKAEAKI